MSLSKPCTPDLKCIKWVGSSGEGGLGEMVSPWLQMSKDLDICVLMCVQTSVLRIYTFRSSAQFLNHRWASSIRYSQTPQGHGAKKQKTKSKPNILVIVLLSSVFVNFVIIPSVPRKVVTHHP